MYFLLLQLNQTQCLQLLCLLSLTQGGLSSQVYKSLKTQYLHVSRLPVQCFNNINNCVVLNKYNFKLPGSLLYLEHPCMYSPPPPHPHRHTHIHTETQTMKHNCPWYFILLVIWRDVSICLSISHLSLYRVLALIIW